MEEADTLHPVDPYGDIENQAVKNLLIKFDTFINNKDLTWPITATPLVEITKEFLDYPGNYSSDVFTLWEYVSREKLFNFVLKDYNGRPNIKFHDQNMAKVFMLFTYAMGVERNNMGGKRERRNLAGIINTIKHTLEGTRLGNVITTNTVILSGVQKNS